jgi:hypothetical protein
MSTVLKIKGVRKWRVTFDDSNWIIQKRRPKNKPPNDWENKFYFSSFGNLVKHLFELEIKSDKLSDFKRMSAHLNEIQESTAHAIQEMEARLLKKNIDIRTSPPDTKRITSVKKANTKRKKQEKRGKKGAKK